MSSEPLLDEEVWKGLEFVENVAGPGAIAEMVDNYAADVPDRLRQMREAVVLGDAARFTYLAHDLKSNSATLGIPKLRSLGAELERSSAEGHLEGLDTRMAEVEGLLPDVLLALACKRASHS
jgi:HPt (histidine-containing phosphotransfer) domain-containing protein